MSDLILLVGIFAALGLGSLMWKFSRRADSTRQPQAPARRREDARDWQRRFGPDSLLVTNFLPPTQNEILETLYVLDYLAPGWETGDADLVERNFLNELALSFPTLRKAHCAFPLPLAGAAVIAGDHAVPGAQKPGASLATEAAIAGRREAFRLTRAQTNALEQMVAGSVCTG